MLGSRGRTQPVEQDGEVVVDQPVEREPILGHDPENLGHEDVERDRPDVLLKTGMGPKTCQRVVAALRELGGMPSADEMPAHDFASSLCALGFRRSLAFSEAKRLMSEPRPDEAPGELLRRTVAFLLHQEAE